MRLRWPIQFDAPAVEQKSETLTFDQLLIRMATAGQVASGISVTPDNAMRCTTVQGIVRALTNAIGSYPPRVGRLDRTKDGETIRYLPNHNVAKLLRRPNKIQTATEFYRMAMKQCALHGNFYALKGSSPSGPIGHLRPIEDPNAVLIDDVNWMTGVTYKVNFDEGTRYVPQRQMLHITSGIPSKDGVTGVSPIELAREAIGICIAAERLIAQLYGNNDVPTLALIGGIFKDPEQYRLWQDKFKEARGAMSDGRGGTLLLPEGMEVKEMSFKPVDAQLLEMRKFQRLEIAQVYGVPPHKLADLERATFSNIEEQSLEFVRDVAKPWVRLFEQAMMRDLLSDSDRDSDHVIRFDMEEATEGKLKERMEAYRAAHEVGAMNPNEIRNRLGLNPRTDDGGDEFVVPANMRSSTNVPDNPESPRGGDEDSEGEPDSSPVAAVR